MAFRYAIRKWGTWLTVIVVLLLWFGIEAIYMHIPAGEPEGHNIHTLNEVYLADFESTDAFFRNFSSVIYGKIGFDGSGITLFLPMLAGLLLGTSFSSGEAHQTVVYCRGRMRWLVKKLIGFYVIVVLMHAATLLLHTLRAGLAFRQYDPTLAFPMYWPSFFHSLWLRSLIICGWLSVTVLIAVATQDPLLTILLSYGYLILSYVMSRIPLDWLTPLSYIRIRELWKPPYADPTEVVIVSLVYLTLTTTAALVLYKRQDIKSIHLK